MESTFEAFGSDSTLTSRHFDHIKCDDLVTRENSTTKDQMEKIKEFYRAIFPLRNDPQTPMDVIGTRWDDSDLYGDLENDPDIEVIKFPAGLSTGIPLWPERYPLDELRKIKSGPKMGSYLYSCLYENDPIPEDSQLFKQKYFKYFSIDPVNHRIIREDGVTLPIGDCFMTIDGATEEGKNDYSAIVVGFMDSNNQIYILDVFHEQIDPTNFLDKMKEYYAKWQCVKYAGQKSLVEKMLGAFLKKDLRENKLHMSFEPLGKNTTLNKEYTIKQLQPWYEGGYIWHNQIYEATEIENELLRFPKGKKDDVIDCEQMLLEILRPSSNVVDIRTYERNSLEMWKRRLKRAMGKFPSESTEVLINERTY